MTSNPLIRTAIPASALGLVWLAMLLLGAGDVDRTVLFMLYARDIPWLAAAARAITRLGDWWVVVAVTIAGAIVLLYKGNGWAAFTLLLASFGGRLLVVLQKDYFARLRPEEQLRLIEVQYDSFPSGHAANPTVAYLPLALLLFHQPDRRRLAAALALTVALLTGISRPMLGVHWPSDVIAGWTFGLLWVAFVFAVMERWRPAARR